MEVRYGAIAISCLTGEHIEHLVREIEMELDIVASASRVSPDSSANIFQP
jgi:hypothetical protein